MSGEQKTQVLCKGLKGSTPFSANISWAGGMRLTRFLDLHWAGLALAGCRPQVKLTPGVRTKSVGAGHALLQVPQSPGAAQAGILRHRLHRGEREPAHHPMSH